MGVCASTAAAPAARLSSFPPGTLAGRADGADSDADGASEHGSEPEWLDVGLVNAFDDPPPPSAEEDAEDVAGTFRPSGGGWRHALPHAGAYTPVQWTRAPPCACVDWAGKRSELCCCALPAAFACVAACAGVTRPGARAQLLRVGEPAWHDALAAHLWLHRGSDCPLDLRGWWWVDGELARSGELVSFDGARWAAEQGGRVTCTLDGGVATPREHTLAGYARAAAALLGARGRRTWEWERPAPLSGGGGGGGGGYERAFEQPGAVWLFRTAADEFRVVEFDDECGATNALRAMYRLRRVMRPRARARAGGAPSDADAASGSGWRVRKLAALAEYVARARAPPPHEPHELLGRCCGWAGAPTYGCGVGAAERVDNAVVPLNPLAHVMWRQGEAAVGAGGGRRRLQSDKGTGAAAADDDDDDEHAAPAMPGRQGTTTLRDYDASSGTYS